MAATGGKRRSFNTDLDHLRKCFNDLDHLNSGYIGLEELTKLVDNMPDSMPDTGDSVVADLMEKLDRDKDGKVKVGVAHSINAHSTNDNACSIVHVIMLVLFLCTKYTPGELS